MDVLLKYWPVAAMVIQGLALWATWSMRQVASSAIASAEKASKDRDQVLDDRIDAEATRITALSGRVDATEAEIQDLPTKADLEKIMGEVKVANANITTANRGIERLEGYFLSRGAGVS